MFMFLRVVHNSSETTAREYKRLSSLPSILRRKFVVELTDSQTRFTGRLVLQLRTRYACVMPARLSVYMSPANSSAVCFAATS
ncbi:hypothetical protein BCAL_0764 [Bifidobacterium callitrichos DSM 23973]|uniref:Uncharacterized protein n=1 Tax=Bifidobacterium callitrichos DSM 23973 TaxID=1437609 RepID=A0A087A9Q7_9BIFI|nr:hypothetical protein BCAL_0764 [Bifidobacterium callitrichos DSM 23973]